ncbi:hypothetical protein QBC46DRAFT_341802 [Diplogelasinospora grovesii]|uniref:Rhodopsin domain-containing protein n=1 Tax=Diplogelasinospora grovesii TaxID=303347 RepID=A0AAN6N8Q3_9PEZI|nr:hypothetical protein QBC46DRAFT_341802 [Diplogelasinospora grovesii]
MAVAPNKPGDTNAHMIYVPVIIFSIVCPFLTGLRVWSRLRKGGRLGPDDYFILAALTFALASSGIMIASCQYGFGQHIFNLTPENKIETLMYFYICQITYKTSINLTKCSILMLYDRIFGNVRWIRWLCWFLVACVALYAIASVTATIFQCNPVPRAFNKLIPGTCIDNGTFWYANAGFSVATDLIILFIPMPLVYQLQIPRVQKIALVVVFALGGFVVITSCLRMTTINIAATSPDSTFDIASTMWTVIEMNVAIVCACLPMVRPLLVKLFPKLMPKSSSGRNKYAYGADTGGISGFGSKGYISSHSQDRNDPSEWARIEATDGIYMTTIRKGDQSSEEYILHDDKSAQTSEAHAAAKKGTHGIHKTVQYSVEYTK